MYFKVVCDITSSFNSKNKMAAVPGIDSNNSTKSTAKLARNWIDYEIDALIEIWYQKLNDHGQFKNNRLVYGVYGISTCPSSFYIGKLKL